MKKTLISLLFLGFMTTSIAAPYSYNDVLKRHSELKQEAQSVLTLSKYLMSKTDDAVIAYRNGDSSSWRTLNQDMAALKQRAATLGGVYIEPYSSCYSLGNATDDYWVAKMAHSATLQLFKQSYEQSLSDCKAEIINKPQDKSELGIIDFS